MLEKENNKESENKDNQKEKKVKKEIDKNLWMSNFNINPNMISN